jgi:UDP-glucose 4-epimerase
MTAERPLRVLVTGGAGYIGSTTAAVLRDRGHAVVVLDDLSRGHRAAVPAGCPLVVGDCGDRALVARTITAHGCEALVHFAAFAYVGESVQEPGRYLVNNGGASFALFDAAVAAGVRRIVFSSSCTVYGTPQTLPLPEDHPRTALSPYGATKIMCEDALDWLTRAHGGLGAVCLRYFNAAGATPERGEDHRPETHLIPLALQAAAGRGPRLTVFGDDYDTRDGTCVRDYVHVLDLADAHVRALVAAARPGLRAYNVGTGDGYTVREVLAAVERVTGRPVPHDVGPRRPGDAPGLYAAGARIRGELGWAPQHSALERIVADAWAWSAAHPEGYGDE